nr:biotin/lipoyl-containing protein [uncultured Sphingomonas sp.]
MSSERFPDDLQLLAEQFLASGWTELRVKTGDTEILFSLDPNSAGLGSAGVAAPTAPIATPASIEASTNAVAATAPAEAPATPDSIDPSWVPITAPNLGTFYRSPKPGAAPFVEVGSVVQQETEVCLLEVMKLFTSVKAGQAGKIVQICAADSELVEAGRILYYIQPGA